MPGDVAECAQKVAPLAVVARQVDLQIERLRDLAPGAELGTRASQAAQRLQAARILGLGAAIGIACGGRPVQRLLLQPRQLQPVLTVAAVAVEAAGQQPLALHVEAGTAQQLQLQPLEPVLLLSGRGPRSRRRRAARAGVAGRAGGRPSSSA